MYLKAWSVGRPEGADDNGKKEAWKAFKAARAVFLHGPGHIDVSTTTYRISRVLRSFFAFSTAASAMQSSPLPATSRNGPSTVRNSATIESSSCTVFKDSTAGFIAPACCLATWAGLAFRFSARVEHKMTVDEQDNTAKVPSVFIESPSRRCSIGGYLSVAATAYSATQRNIPLQSSTSA